MKIQSLTDLEAEMRKVARGESDAPADAAAPSAATEEEGNRMTKQNPHIGSTFESWLDEQGIRQEVTAAAIKSV
jgi:hypothetical protein